MGSIDHFLKALIREYRNQKRKQRATEARMQKQPAVGIQRRGEPNRLQAELSRDDDLSLPDAKALVAAKKKQVETRSNGELPRDILINDELATKRDIAALKAEIQATDTKIQLLLDVIHFDRFMKGFQNPDNADLAKDLLMDLVSEEVTDDPEQYLVNCAQDLEVRLVLATRWRGEEKESED